MAPVAARSAAAGSLQAVASPTATPVRVTEMAEVATTPDAVPTPLAVKVGLRRTGAGLPRRPRLEMVHLRRPVASLGGNHHADISGGY